MVQQRKQQIALFLMGLLFLITGCAHHFAIAPDSPVRVYSPSGDGTTLAAKFAPEFVLYDTHQTHNRLGRPVVVSNMAGHAKVTIDVKEPVVYYQERSFHTERDAYRNLIYRIHFPKVPFRLIPFNLTYGNNPGLLLIITLNRLNQPVLITSAGTCGCYKAMVPTDHLSDAALPEGWLKTTSPQKIYGEILPRRVAFDGGGSSRLRVHLRPDVHRVMHLEAGSGVASAFEKQVSYQLEPTENLNRLPSQKGPVSLYYTRGILNGHVKGALKPLETVLLGWLSWDLFVGMDKAYADTGNPFYTSLKPWNRRQSDMWHFDRFLRFWGWRL